MSKIYLVGHKNPDTDSILAPLVYTQYLKDQGIDAEAVKIGKINNESKFILEYTGVEKPRRVDSLPAGSKVFLLDHNEKVQAIENLSELEIVGIVDHHNFGGITTSGPIFARVEPLACTMSVIRKIFREKNYTPNQKMAQLMISAIISDTLFFRSPTTTDEDRQIVEELNKIAQISDLEKYSLQMFDAKSDLGDISPKEIITKDFKEYEVDGTKMAIGVMETTNPNYALSRQSEIVSTMKQLKNESGLDFIIFSVIDILNESNTTFVVDDFEKKVVKEVFGADTVNNLANLGNRVSRKKQIIPQLTDYFNL